MDDGAVVPRALLGMRLEDADEAAKLEAVERSRRWVMAMQSRDGGWAAFDRDNDRQALLHVPFSEFMSPLDPTCSDVTAHVIEFLTQEIRQGKGAEVLDAMQRARAYLYKTQEADGAWYGRWGVNYVYGTALTLTALSSAGDSPDSRHLYSGARWLFAKQNEDGGWGETCETYRDPGLRGCGASTASQTAWALIGLSTLAVQAVKQNERSPGIGFGRREFDRDLVASIKGGIIFLLESQKEDGGWIEPYFTGGGFPKVFYLRYELYKIYFPLIALARSRIALKLIKPLLLEG